MAVFDSLEMGWVAWSSVQRGFVDGGDWFEEEGVVVIAVVVAVVIVYCG